MQGVPTPDEVEAEFRKHYLVTGNASASARAVNLSVFTGCELARKANADPEFAKARKDIRDRALHDGEVMLLAGMQVGLERLNKEPPDPVKLAERGYEKIHVQDSGAQYLRSLAASVDVIAKLRKLEAEIRGEIIGEREVTIRVIAAELPKDDDGGEKA